MEMEPKFDLEKFRDRCVQEFCELTEKPTEIVGHNKLKAIKHYAPGIEKSRLKGWQRAGQHLILQTNFAAPFIFDKDISFGVIEIHRPIMVIKFGNECYWRIVPKRHAAEAVEQAKNRNIFKKLKTVPLPKRTEIKEQTVESFLERVRLETLNPSEDCKGYKGMMTLSDGTLLNSNNIWHPSAQHGIDMMVKLHEKDIDVSAYYQMFAHVQPGVTEGWIVVDEPGVGSFIEYRIDRTFYQKIVPDFLREQMCAYAKKLRRFYPGPSHLLNGGNITYLKK